MSCNILLVCTGNTCRSIMAEALLEAELERSDVPRSRFDLDSAGTFACEDQNPTEKTCTVMSELGFDVSRHKSKQVDKKLVKWADLILTMESAHIEQLEAMFPKHESKMHTLKGFVKDVPGFPGEVGFDVLDPYDEPLDDHRECAKELGALMKLVVRKLSAEY